MEGSGYLVALVLFFIVPIIWSFLVWLGWVKILIIVGSFVLFIIFLSLLISLKERWDKKKKTINIIQKGNLQKFKQLFNKFNSLEKYIQKAIYLSLSDINDPQKIKIICQECFSNRNPLLVQLIVEKKWIASQPASAKVYTILKNNQLNFIENSDGEEVKYLLESLKDEDPEIANRAKQSLEKIKIINQHGIDYLCQEWLLRERDKFLESIIVKHKYQAVSPVRVKILTALKTEQLELIENEGEEVVIILLEVLKEQHPEIVDNSLKVLSNLTNQEGINYFSQQWVKDRDKKLEEIIIKQEYFATFPSQVKILTGLKIQQLELLSNLNLEEIIILINTFDDSDKVIADNAQKMGDFLQDPSCKSLMYFITEKWDKYERIDFDQSMLKNIFYDADPILRKKITEKIKISGKSDWLQVIFAERKRKNIELMTDYDWQVTIELLSKTDHDREKWNLAQQAPPFYSQQLLKQIDSFNLINREKSYQQNLIQLGKKVIQNPSDSISWINDNSKNVTLTDHTNSINCLVMNREDTLLASGSSDKTIKLWELPSLSFFIRLPLSKIINYSDYIQDNLKRNDLNENQRNWFKFMLALVNNYRRFEIDIEDAPIISEAGEFDIEIEG